VYASFSHVADHGACGHPAERDDLTDAVGPPVLLLHVPDHAFASVLAEVDVDVRHRDAIGVQEALEQEVVPERIHRGDAQ
jgi:hypothetical protein